MSRSRREDDIASRVALGFTLLEVLAAVAILGILFTVLFAVSITGFRAEGTNMRRLRASLVADRVLNELEAPMLAGVYPEPSSDESEEDEFTVQVEVKPLAEVGEDGLVGFLEEQVPDLMPLLSVIEVRVSWLEGSQELAVHRTTHVFDEAQWEESLPETEPETEGVDALPEDLSEGVSP